MREWLTERWWGVQEALHGYGTYRRDGFGPVEALRAAYSMGKLKFRLVCFERYCAWRREAGLPMLGE